jgi:molecular chaperone DnaK
MGELADKVSADLKGSVNTAVEDAKKALESGDADKIKTAYSALEKASHKLSEEAYKATAAQGEAGANGASSDGAGAAKEDVVDADYEEVRDNK